VGGWAGGGGGGGGGGRGGPLRDKLNYEYLATLLLETWSSICWCWGGAHKE